MHQNDQATPPLHTIDIKRLRIFKTVVECGGFSAAESTLGIGRSTISKHIADLETRLSIRLCERGRTGFRVTSYGKTVYQAILELLDAHDQFRSQITATKQKLSGTLSLWVMDHSPFEHNTPVATAIKKFKKRPGEVNIKLNSASPEATEEAVLTRQASIGVTISNNRLPTLTYKIIGSESTSFYCASNHYFGDHRIEHITDKHFSHIDYVTRGYLHNRDEIIQKKWKSSAVAAHVESLLLLILSGEYIGVLPEHIASPWVAAGKIIKLTSDIPLSSQPIYIVFRQQTSLIPSISAMLEDITSSYELGSERGIT